MNKKLLIINGIICAIATGGCIAGGISALIIAGEQGLAVGIIMLCFSPLFLIMYGVMAYTEKNRKKLQDKKIAKMKAKIEKDKIKASNNK